MEALVLPTCVPDAYPEGLQGDLPGRKLNINGAMANGQVQLAAMLSQLSVPEETAFEDIV